MMVPMWWKYTAWWDIEANCGVEGQTEHWPDHTSIIVILILLVANKLNMVALEQGEPLGHGIYPFFPIV